MGNNNPVVPQPPAPEAQVPVPTPSSGESNKMIIWFVIGLVVVVMLVGGIYLLLGSRQTAINSKTTTGQPIVQITPKPEDMVSALDRDLNSLNIDATNNADSDFTLVDQDLQSL